MDDPGTAATHQLGANLSVAALIIFDVAYIYGMFILHQALWVHTGWGRRLHRVKNLLIAINFRLYRRNSLDILHHSKENVCDQCGEKFANHEDLITHARHVHHHTIVKCHECGKEFIHEKDRLHHVREEHKKKVESREQKNLHNMK
jgi:RNase P subunit RPR2